MGNLTIWSLATVSSTWTGAPLQEDCAFAPTHIKPTKGRRTRLSRPGIPFRRGSEKRFMSGIADECNLQQPQYRNMTNGSQAQFSNYQIGKLHAGTVRKLAYHLAQIAILKVGM
jgi:hypothetical protein